MTRGRLPQRAGLPGLNGGGAAAAVPMVKSSDMFDKKAQLSAISESDKPAQRQSPHNSSKNSEASICNP